MKKLKKFLKKGNNIFFRVRSQYSKIFLQFAKKNGCRWINEKGIDLRKDDCGAFMGVDKDLRLGIMSAMCWCHLDSDVKKINFDRSML